MVSKMPYWLLGGDYGQENKKDATDSILDMLNERKNNFEKEVFEEDE